MDCRNIARLKVEPGADRSRALLRVAVACALVLAVTGRGGPSGESVSLAHESSTSGGGRAAGGSAYTLMQMNLCLSGFAGCYGKVAYPAGVQEAVARIRDARPDAVTLNETCQADVAQIARRIGARVGVDVCTAHLATRSATAAAVNDAQCAELTALLERRAATGKFMFGAT